MNVVRPGVVKSVLSKTSNPQMAACCSWALDDSVEEVRRSNGFSESFSFKRLKQNRESKHQQKI